MEKTAYPNAVMKDKTRDKPEIFNCASFTNDYVGIAPDCATKLLEIVRGVNVPSGGEAFEKLYDELKGLAQGDVSLYPACKFCDGVDRECCKGHVPFLKLSPESTQALLTLGEKNESVRNDPYLQAYLEKALGPRYKADPNADTVIMSGDDIVPPRLGRTVIHHSRAKDNHRAEMGRKLHSEERLETRTDMAFANGDPCLV